jgi:hypothetical protein
LVGSLDRWRRRVSLVLIVATMPLALGCFGQFPLTRAVYRMNASVPKVSLGGAVPEGTLKSVVFWALVIVPVYPVAAVADALVPNLIEFWTGKHVRVVSVTDQAGQTTVFRPSEDGREALLTVSRDGQPATEVRFVRVSDAVCEVRSADDALLGTAVQTRSGLLLLKDAEGNVIRAIDGAGA